MSVYPSILVVDYGSQYTYVIARTLRELGLRCTILSPSKSEVWLARGKPKAVILSGGDASVTDATAPILPNNLLSSGIPILGICYGMQLLAKTLGGEVKNTQEHAEYGPADVSLDTSPLFKGIEGKQNVWASHGDTVSKLPRGFKTIARSSEYEHAGMADVRRNIWTVQFHPEVVDTPCGKQLLSNFLFDICGCGKDWQPSNIISDIQNTFKEKANKKVIVGFSGGVDSTVLSTILSPVFGKNLLAITIDGGHLRKNELKEIKKYAKTANVQLKVVDARENCLKALQGVTDAEKKRVAFRAVYKKIFENEIQKWNADYIGQGTLITDLIESGKTGGALIKTHHNTGLAFNVEELSPLDHLFKYEVRALAKELDLPKSVLERQPFPGPGLFIRIFGGHVTNKRLVILQEADEIVRNVIDQASNALPISQLVVGLDCSKTVGVKGDSREYGYNIVVRAVETIDFMTTKGVQLPDNIRREIISKVTQIPGVTRVFFDETNKPPATTEFE